MALRWEPMQRRRLSRRWWSSRCWPVVVGAAAVTADNNNHRAARRGGAAGQRGAACMPPAPRTAHTRPTTVIFRCGDAEGGAAHCSSFMRRHLPSCSCPEAGAALYSFLLLLLFVIRRHTRTIHPRQSRPGAATPHRAASSTPISALMSPRPSPAKAAPEAPASTLEALAWVPVCGTSPPEKTRRKHEQSCDDSAVWPPAIASHLHMSEPTDLRGIDKDSSGNRLGCVRTAT